MPETLSFLDWHNLPSFKLDVDKGDININPLTTGANGYRIGGNYVLWHTDNPDNIFVGLGAGLSITTATHCTFVGFNAGNGDL
ncbi:MAG: hypothetical protein ABIJ97_09170 [Bacteroidota bacterium]